MARPRPTPLEVLVQNMAREEIKLKSSVQVLTAHDMHKKINERKNKNSTCQNSSTEFNFLF